jgi:hypothetical protein
MRETARWRASGAKDRQQRFQTCPPTITRPYIVLQDRPETAADVPDVRRVELRPSTRVFLREVHGLGYRQLSWRKSHDAIPG